MGADNHLHAPVGKALRPQALGFVRFGGILRAPVDKHDGAVGIGLPCRNGFLHRFRVVQGMEDIGRILRQRVAVGGLGQAEDGTADAVDLQDLIWPQRAICHRLNAGAYNACIAVKRCGQVNGVRPLVQGMVSSTAYHVKSGLDHRLSHLQRCSKDGIGAVLPRRIYINRLLLDGCHIKGRELLQNIGKHAVKAPVFPAEIVIVDLPVDQKVSQRRHGEGGFGQRNGGEPPGEPVPGCHVPGAVGNQQPRLRVKLPRHHLHANVRCHPQRLHRSCPDGIDIDMLRPRRFLLFFPEGAAVAVAFFSPGEKQQLLRPVVVDIAQKCVLHQRFFLGLPGTFAVPDGAYVPVFQLDLPLGHGELPFFPCHPVRRCVLSP